MKLNKRPQQKNFIEILSTYFLVDHLLHLLSIHWLINPLMMISMQVILLYCSLIALFNNYSDIKTKEETFADSSSKKSDSVHIS